ncbi:MAG TPA: DUF2795 domain-containing protein [Caldilineaceae bacterium]|nr:DUF2795 domain-containing protein [Caldilineaceae bacterium]
MVDNYGESSDRTPTDDITERVEDEDIGAEGGPLGTVGGPDAVTGGAWGAHEPVLADLELYLEGINYPVSKDDLVRHLRRQETPPSMVTIVEQLPAQEFQSAAAISRALDRAP